MNDLKNLSYSSIKICKFQPSGIFAEHTPVIGSWDMEVKQVNKERRRTVIAEMQQEEMKELFGDFKQEEVQGREISDTKDKERPKEGSNKKELFNIFGDDDLI